MEASGIRSDRSMCAVFLEISSSSFSPGKNFTKKKAASGGERVRAHHRRERTIMITSAVSSSHRAITRSVFARAAFVSSGSLKRSKSSSLPTTVSSSMPYLSLDVPERKLPARVEHLDIRADSPIQLSKALHREVKDVTENYFQELIDFGSVYISDELEENFRLERNAVKNKMQRVTSDVVLPPNSRHYVRAHVHPRRFPVATDVQTRWNERVVKETEDFLVVWKPAGLPVTASVDNAKENVLRCVSSLSSPKKDEAKNLFPTHRLDVTTSGVVIVAKTSNAAKIFSKILRDGHVEKRYLVLTKKPPTLGVMLHEYEPSERMVGEGARMVKMKSMGMDLLKDDLNVYLKNKMKIPSNVAMLRVEKSEPVEFDGEKFYESTVELITGRTHQIRAQFSKENLALVNDCLYANSIDDDDAPLPRVPEPEEKIGLHAWSLKINADTSLGPNGVEFRAENEDIWWR